MITSENESRLKTSFLLFIKLIHVLVTLCKVFITVSHLSHVHVLTLSFSCNISIWYQTPFKSTAVTQCRQMPHVWNDDEFLKYFLCPRTRQIYNYEKFKLQKMYIHVMSWRWQQNFHSWFISNEPTLMSPLNHQAAVLTVPLEMILKDKLSKFDESFL